MTFKDGLPEAGFVRLSGIIKPKGPLPFSQSWVWAGVKAGTFPKPIKLAPRITAWSVESIRQHLAEKIEESR